MKETAADSPIRYHFKALVFDANKKFRRAIEILPTIGSNLILNDQEYNIKDVGNLVAVYNPSLVLSEASLTAHDSAWYGGSSIDHQFLSADHLGHDHRPKTSFTSTELN